MKVKWQSDAPNMELKVPSEIKIDGYIPTEEDLTFTGSCRELFKKNRFAWLLNNYMSKLQFNNITNLVETFLDAEIDTDLSNLTFYLSNKCDLSYMFKRSNLSHLPRIKGEVYNLSNLFDSCKNGAAIPEDFFNDLTFPSNGYTIYFGNMFYGCKNLIKTPSFDVFKKILGTPTPSAYSSFYYHLFNYSDVLEVKNLPVLYTNSNVGNNMFDSMVNYTSKLSSFTFEPNQTARFRYQVLDFTETGYKVSLVYKNYFNSVYNYNSAVETINSLPDTSAFLAEVGGTNTIKFYSEQGANTEGGAIGNLTAEEIAVAAAKGWTVAFK